MKYDRVVFVGSSGTIREPMAVGIMGKLMPGINAEARGMVVLFSEPMNQKVQAVLAANDIALSDFSSSPLTEEDFAPGSLILVMEKEHRDKLIAQFEGAGEENVRVLTEFTGEELEVLDPYGQGLQVYGLCYETLYNTLSKLKEKIQEGYNE